MRKKIPNILVSYLEENQKGPERMHKIPNKKRKKRKRRKGREGKGREKKRKKGK